jgi:hypothetical protein
VWARRGEAAPGPAAEPLARERGTCERDVWAARVATGCAGAGHGVSPQGSDSPSRSDRLPVTRTDSEGVQEGGWMTRDEGAIWFCQEPER